MKLNPNENYLTLNLKWPIENYVHEIGINVQIPEYITTKLYFNDTYIKAPQYLYKFFTPDDYNFESLEIPYLYFGNPEKFNDSFDCIIYENE